MATSANTMNESAYGNIADSYATKYGVPTDIFRNAIRTKTNFDPTFSGSVGKGIAGLNVDPNAKSINAFDVGQSLDIAARYLSSIYKETNSWDTATQDFVTGIPYEKGQGQTGGASGDWLNVPQDAQAASDKSIWRWSLDDFKAWFKSYTWAALFFTVGVLVILASIYVLIVKGGDGGK